MPEPVAQRYRDGENDIVDEHQDVAVLFAEISGFDDHARSAGERGALAELNGIIASFDEAASDLGAERVRTLRTGYLASCGLLSPRVANARRMVDLALEMQQIVERSTSPTAPHSVCVRRSIRGLCRADSSVG